MTKHEADLPPLNEAKAILSSVRGRLLSQSEREKLAVRLAALMLSEANHHITWAEKQIQAELSRMMRDPQGKVFTTCMTDQCFRASSAKRVADQLVYLLNEWGIPQYLGGFKRFSLFIFQLVGKPFSWLFVPLSRLMLRLATSRVILPGAPRALQRHMAKRRTEGVRLNLNHLGEAILGEEEAKRRLGVYLDDLTQPQIEYISVKISTIYSQIHLLGWDTTIEILSERLRQLYRVAMNHRFTRADGTQVPKFVNLDMEEYRDLQLTKELFQKVLDEEEFKGFSAGIVLQAYLPDSHEIQKELTQWAVARVKQGGAPIKIRIVKGANLAMEQFEASARDWAQAPYRTKADVDANYKKMLSYGASAEHARAVHLGVASHNLFDISYALLLRAEHEVSHEVNFEMLEGMADHMRRVVQQLSQDILLYCPVATKEDFQSAIAYLIRRLDENTGPDNFLRVTFGLKPGSSEWDEQVLLFTKACQEMQTIYTGPRRTQDRHNPPVALSKDAPFENEADTDFSLPANRKWAAAIAKRWETCPLALIPLVIEGKEIKRDEGAYTLATAEEIEKAIVCAKQEEKSWSKTSALERCEILSRAAQLMRIKKGDLIGGMMREGNKSILEGDPEVSEAIDFAEYYLRSLQTMSKCPTLEWHAKGTILVTPPWNFPVSIPAGGILAALATGNCVLFKPAPEAVLSGWQLVQILWEAGVPKKALQFINCVDEPIGSKLVADSRINGVILTGATQTARLFMKMRPGIELSAETGGKNGIIVTALSDRDLAIKDVVSSAFGHNGQKCSACSLLVLEKEVYDDAHFLNQLKDAVESLRVGPCWDLSAKVTPLIHAPSGALLKGLTTLEKGERWLVEPRQDPHNPALWSPGVKLGVKKGSFSHRTEFFGPLLSVIRASDLDEAIDIVNDTPYGLTSGLHSLDEREQKIWMEKIIAGNCYINRGITGAIVRRQPFGGTKASSFGPGLKAGGPSYIMQFAHCKEVGLPQEKAPLSTEVNLLAAVVQKYPLSAEELGIWYASIAGYAYFAKRFSEDHDPSLLIGQDNLLRYRPYKGLTLRIQKGDTALDVLRMLAAVLSVNASVTISWDTSEGYSHLKDQLHSLRERFTWIHENSNTFAKRIQEGKVGRVRLASAPAEELITAAAQAGIFLDSAPVLAHGRFELMHYLREIAFSIDYHRYGNLGMREQERRKPLH